MYSRRLFRNIIDDHYYRSIPWIWENLNKGLPTVALFTEAGGVRVKDSFIPVNGSVPYPEIHRVGSSLPNCSKFKNALSAPVVSFIGLLAPCYPPTGSKDRSAAAAGELCCTQYRQQQRTEQQRCFVPWPG